jgi:lipid-A-disaccharide synthase
VLKVPFVSLVNLVANREVVTELVANTFTVNRLRTELQKILDGPVRQTILDGYAEVKRRLGDQKAPDHAAKIIYTLLNKNSQPR